MASQIIQGAVLMITEKLIKASIFSYGGLSVCLSVCLSFFEIMRDMQFLIKIDQNKYRIFYGLCSSSNLYYFDILIINNLIRRYLPLNSILLNPI